VVPIIESVEIGAVTSGCSIIDAALGFAKSYNEADMTNRPPRLALFALIVCVAITADAADRKWQTGTWRDSGDARTYVILARTVRLHLEDAPASEKRAIEMATSGPVTFAVEGNRAFVRDAKGAEHELHVLRSVDLNYTATGSGHFVKAISADGLTLTLEDNSVWDLDPLSQHFTIEWQAFDGISVRRSGPDQDFDYEIDNTAKDEGALARYTPP
jgi:hypothetical protein